MSLCFDRRYLASFVAISLAFYLLIAGLLKFYLVFNSSNLTDNIAGQSYREFAAGDAFDITKRLESILTHNTEIICIRGRKKGVEFFSQSRGPCSPGIFVEKTTIDKQDHGGIVVDLYFGLPDVVTVFTGFMAAAMTLLIGLLIVSIRRLDRQRHITALTVSEKEAAIGRMVSNISHDMKSYLGSLSRSISSSNLEASGVIKRLHTMVEALRHGEADALIHRSYSSLDLGEIVSHINKMGKEIRFEAGNSKIDGFFDKMKLERVVLNLVNNAVEADSDFVSVASKEEGSSLVISVVDDGPGVPEEHIDSLFERGATFGKEGGTGIGLAYARHVVKGHGGEISYRRKEGLTVFEVLISEAIPKYREDRQVEVNSVSRSGEHRNPGKIKLFVDIGYLDRLDDLLDPLPADVEVTTDISCAHVCVTDSDETLLKAVGQITLKVKPDQPILTAKKALRQRLTAATKRDELGLL